MPTVYNIPLERAVPIKLASELQKRLFYVSNEISDFQLVEAEHGISSIDVVSNSGQVEIAALSAKLNEVIKTDILKQKVFPAKVVWQADEANKPTYHTAMFDQLLEKGIAFESGEGQVGFGEPLLSLMDYFDKRVKQIAFGLPNPREFRYPTLLPTHVLEEFGYFASFPQFMMFVTRLHNDLDVYSAFVRAYERDKKIPPEIFAHCQNHDYCLPPTMCYHTYHQYRGQELADDMVVTAKGKSFRYESKYYRGLERLWDFTIREIVFLGTREFVLDCRQHFMEQAFALMEEFDLYGFCEVANDPFFVASDTAGKIFSQRALELKYELRINVAEEQPVDRSIAVASFNFHETFFGDTFGISRGNQQPSLTGCVGFGLERLVYAFLCQHGLDEKQWPESVRRGL